MKAVIIAGGLGTRLRPLTWNIPKPIVPLVNRPFVYYLLHLVKKHGVDEVVLNLRYLSDDIKEILSADKRLGIKIHYSIEKEPLGTCGAVKNAEDIFKDDEEVLVFNGDVLTDLDLTALIDFHRKNKAAATLTLTEVEDPTQFGLVITDKNDRVKEFIEKPSWERVTQKNINAGTYVLDPKIFKRVPKGKPFSFERQLFPGLLKDDQKMFGFTSNAYWLDIGNPFKYMQAHRAVLLREVITEDFDLERTRDGVWLDKGVKAAKSAKLFGPSLIGKNCVIGDKTYVYHLAVLGDGCEVGDESLIEESVILEGTKIGSGTRLKNCVIGRDCVIEDNVHLNNIVLADKTVIKKSSRIEIFE